MESEKDVSSLIKYVRGFPFPNVPFFKPDNITESLDYIPEDGDVVLCSYPKTGSTWMQYVIWAILHKGESFPSLNDAMYRLMPFMEVTGVEIIKSQKEPRIYKNHYPYHMMKINTKAKYIYSYRNPSDVLVSFYHFFNSISGSNLKFNEYFELFIDGNVACGNFFDHFWSFYRHEMESHLLLVSYEELKKDPRQTILVFAKFLGEDYYKTLVEDEKIIDKIVEMTSFDYMKNNLSLSIPNEDGSPENNLDQFFRKGVVGDGKKSMSNTQIQRLYKEIKHRMEGTHFSEMWCT